MSLALAIRSVPLVTVLHTVETAPQPAVQHALFALLTASVSVVTLSPAGCRGVAGWHSSVGLPAQLGAMCVHVPHGVPQLPLCAREPLKRALGVTSDTFLVLTGGLLSSPKGVDGVIAAMPLVAEQMRRPVQLLVAGEAHPVHGAGYLDKLHALVAELKAESLVTFKTQYMDSEQLHATYQAADVFVAAHSASEQTSSGTMLLAMAAGAPVIATPFSQAAELLADGTAGMLVPFNNATALAHALVALAHDPARAARTRAGSYVAMAHRTWPTVASAFVDAASRPAVDEWPPAPRYEGPAGLTQGGHAELDGEQWVPPHAGLTFMSDTSAEVGDGQLAVSAIRNVAWVDGVGPGWYPLDTYLSKRRWTRQHGGRTPSWGLDSLLLNGNFLSYEQGPHRASSRVLEDLNTSFKVVPGPASQRGTPVAVLESAWHQPLGNSRTGIVATVTRRLSVGALTAGGVESGGGGGVDQHSATLDVEASISGPGVEPAAHVWLTVGFDQLSSNPDVEWDSVTGHDTGGQHVVHAACSWQGSTLSVARVRAFAIHGRRLGDGSSTAVNVALRTAPAEVHFVCNGDMRLQYTHFDVALHEADSGDNAQGGASMRVHTKADVKWTG